MLERSGITIGELARRAGVGVETVRFYEREGLLPRPPRPTRGFRRYLEQTVVRMAGASASSPRPTKRSKKGAEHE